MQYCEANVFFKEWYESIQTAAESAHKGKMQFEEYVEGGDESKDGAGIAAGKVQV